jgi:hypothetical protein
VDKLLRRLLDRLGDQAHLFLLLAYLDKLLSHECLELLLVHRLVLALELLFKIVLTQQALCHPPLLYRA